jgi:hypothetical protein
LSYDLIFWRQNEGDERAPQPILEAFSEGAAVDGIPQLPVEDVLAKLLDAFPAAIREPNGSREWIHWTSPDGQSGFEVEWTPQYVWITCRPLDADRANQMIDIANAFGCALFDPQTGARFSQP